MSSRDYKRMVGRHDRMEIRRRKTEGEELDLVSFLERSEGVRARKRDQYWRGDRFTEFSRELEKESLDDWAL